MRSVPSLCIPSVRNIALTCLAVLIAATTVGCGKTVSNTATEQLLLSDSVDRAIRSVDFSALSGRRCYLNTEYIPKTKSPTFVNAEYVTSSLRNQMISAGAILADNAKGAEIMVEPRLGVLGSNENEVTYGIPSSNILSQAASLVPTAPPIPTIPEISLARKNDHMAAAKLAVFAYNAESGLPVWQSGTSTAQSHAKDTWFFGVGPIQSGTIYEQPQFAGVRIRLPLVGAEDSDEVPQPVSLDQQHVFMDSPVPLPAPEPKTKTADGKSAPAALAPSRE